jgi:IclR family KDG regulon transcriptional repressor
MHEMQDTGAARILAILEALAHPGPVVTSGLTVTGLARSLGRDKSSVSRQLKPLVDLGLVERDEDGLHRLGWRLFALAAQAGDQRLLMLAPPVMRQLGRQVKERVHLSIRRNDEVLTILSEGPYRAVEAAHWVGRTVPIACTSSGRALLFDHAADEIRTLLEDGFRKGPGSKAPATVEAVIDRVGRARALGYAAVVDEFDDDLSAVAAPVRDGHGRIVAALNISAPSYRLQSTLHAIGRQTSQAAHYLSQALSSPPAQNAPPSGEQHNSLPGLPGDMRRIS